MLRQLREAAGVSQRTLARRVGTMSQSTIARFERGPRPPAPLAPGLPPDVDQVAKIADALGVEVVPAETRRHLLYLAQQAADEAAGIVRVRVALQKGTAHLQRRIRERERNAAHVATFHPILVPGLVQTEGYIRAVAASGDDPVSEQERFVAERLARQAQMREPGRRCTVILTEGSLMWGVPGAEVMAEQCDHIARLAAAPPDGWTIALIPALPSHGRPVYPPSAFDVYDDARQVFVGTTAGNALTSDEAVVADHVRWVGWLLALADVGEAAAGHAQRIADDYRARA